MITDQELLDLFKKEDSAKIEDLLKRNAVDINKVIRGAIVLKKKNVLEKLSQNFSKEYLNKGLIAAVSEENHEFAIYFINQGADLSAVSEDDTLLKIAIQNRDEKMIELLLKAGVDPNYTLPGTFPPLILAINSKNNAIALQLLNAGANPNCQDNSYTTALDSAILRDNFILIDVLLKKGVKIQHCNLKGETTLDLARDSGYSETVIKLMKHAENQKKEGVTDTLDEDNLRFIKDCHSIRAAGHLLGLSTVIDVRKPNSDQNTLIQTEFNLTLSSIQILTDSLKKYHASLELNDPEGNEISKYLKECIEDFEYEQNYLQFDGIVGAKEVLNRYQGNPPIQQRKGINIHTGFEGHDFTLAIEEDELVYCNRGMGKLPQKTGTLVYKLDKKAREALTPEYIESLNPAGAHRPSMEVMTERINRILTDPYPVQLPSKEQKYGTCTLVNAKSSIEGKFFIKKKKDLEKKLAKKVEEHSTEAIIVCGIEVKDSNTIELAAKEFARRHYKKMTAGIRNIKIEELIKEANRSDTKSLSFSILEKYLMQHHGQGRLNLAYDRSKKMKEELGREFHILKSLRPEIRKELIKNLEQSNIDLFFIAILHRDLELVKFLLDNGANPNRNASSGQNLLAYTAYYGQLDIFDMLLKKGGDPTKIDINGFSAENLAKQYNLNNVMSLIEAAKNESGMKPAFLFSDQSKGRETILPKNLEDNIAKKDKPRDGLKT